MGNSFLQRFSLQGFIWNQNHNDAQDEDATYFIRGNIAK
jgi:hypothetical protein